MKKNDSQLFWFSGVILGLSFCTISSSFATLGKSETLIQSKAKSLGYTVSKAKAHKSGRVYELSVDKVSALSKPANPPLNSHVDPLDSKMSLRIKEFVSSTGIVYALGWSGSTQPDLSTLLGDYEMEFRTAQMISPVRHYRLPFRRFESGRLKIQVTKRGKFLRGYAYIVPLKPSDVEAQDLQ